MMGFGLEVLFSDIPW